jgi:hypothetical protein
VSSLSTIKEDNICTINLTNDTVVKKLNIIGLDLSLMNTVKRSILNAGVSPGLLPA